MRKQVLATLVLPLAVACGESPLAPHESAGAESRAGIAPPYLLVLSEEQITGLATVLEDARVRVLPGLGYQRLEPALARVGAALAGTDGAELDAAVAAALASLDAAGAQNEPAAELDLIRLALADVSRAAHPAPGSDLVLQ